MNIDEKVFRKMGAEWKLTGDVSYAEAYDDKTEASWAWYLNNRLISFPVFYGEGSKLEPLPKTLPPISSVWEVCAEFLGKFMRGKGWEITIGLLLGAEGQQRKDYQLEFRWWQIGSLGTYKGHKVIHNHKIAEAACEAFMKI